VLDLNAAVSADSMPCRADQELRDEQCLEKWRCAANPVHGHW